MSGSNLLAVSEMPRFFRVDSSDIAPPPNPAEGGRIVRLHVRSLSVMQKEALTVSSSGGHVWRMVSDEGAYLNGFDEAPPPLAFLSTGMVASYMDEVLALATQCGLDTDGIRLTLDNYYSMQGSVLRGTMVAGAEDPALTIELPKNQDRDTALRLLLDATVASPAYGLVSTAQNGIFALSLNGTAIDPGEIGRLDNPPEPLSAEIFDHLRPAPGKWGDLLSRGEMTPQSDEATSTPGSSLAESQDRRLHVRVVCTLRSDGVKIIEQSMFNPQGTMFRFLSDAKGKDAPDAASYISAGIGFCFMTQLGRYAQITKRNLSRYAIAQDIAFSAGGASEQTGSAGHTSPPRTNVLISSSENADFARELLKMGEQTCFLHALCRTVLKTRIKLR